MASKLFICCSHRRGVGETRTNYKTSSSLESGSCKVVMGHLLRHCYRNRLLSARSLTHVRSAIEDENPLTPNHFLIGTAFPNVLACVFQEIPALQTKTWTQLQQRLEAIYEKFSKGVHSNTEYQDEVDKA